MDVILREFLDEAIIRYNLVLFKSEIAKKVILSCKKNKKMIFGIDVFLIKEEFIEPFGDHSIDFSNIVTKEQSWARAIDFIETKHIINNEFLYEVVYETDF
jgi:hypothetical protein